MAAASAFVVNSETLSTWTFSVLAPNCSSMTSPGFTSWDAFAVFPLTETCPQSQASLATVRRLISRDTFRYLSNLMFRTSFEQNGAAFRRAAILLY